MYDSQKQVFVFIFSVVVKYTRCTCAQHAVRPSPASSPGILHLAKPKPSPRETLTPLPSWPLAATPLLCL